MSNTSKEVQIEVITAKSNGGEVQYFDVSSGEWREKIGDTWQFGCIRYRVKPEYSYSTGSGIVGTLVFGHLVQVEFGCHTKEVNFTQEDLLQLLKICRIGE